MGAVADPHSPTATSDHGIPPEVSPENPSLAEHVRRRGGLGWSEETRRLFIAVAEALERAHAQSWRNGQRGLSPAGVTLARDEGAGDWRVADVRTAESGEFPGAPQASAESRA